MPKIHLRKKFDDIDLSPDNFKVYDKTALGLSPEEQFKKAGWSLSHQGGGCMAWDFVNTDLTYFLATDDSGVCLPRDMNSIILGHYSDQGEPINQPYMVTMDQVEFIVKAYNQVAEEIKDEG